MTKCASCDRTFQERPLETCHYLLHWRLYVAVLEVEARVECEHVWQDYGPNHECSYVDCPCEYTYCIKCGIDEETGS